ncbi:hypothetical protein FRC06_004721 [Ceratobasidium sp. 370]|nr:hypothetical protein FRC06_004721 [Ceratobasidium sp. 370]
MYPNNFSSLRPLPIKAGRFIELGKLPGLITITNTTANPDAPRVTKITVGAHSLSTSTVPEPKVPEESGVGVYQTLESTTCSATDVPLSVSRGLVAHAPPLKWSNNRDPIPVVSTPARPKRSITVQRLGMQTPTPPWAIDHMLTRGGGRFSLMSLPEFHRPASKRLAVQYVEDESDVAATEGHIEEKRSVPTSLLSD